MNVLTLAIPPLLPLLSSILPRRAGLRAVDHLRTLAGDLRQAAAQTFFAIAFLPDHARRMLVDRRIRVNCVAPGPVWTPLIPSTMPPDKTASFGGQAPMDEAAQPDDIAPSFVFLASERLSAFYTGQVLSPIGGETHPG